MALKGTIYMHGWFQSDIRPESKETRMVIACAGQPGLSRFLCPDFGGAAPPTFVGKDDFCASNDEP